MSALSTVQLGIIKRRVDPELCPLEPSTREHACMGLDRSVRGNADDEHDWSFGPCLRRRSDQAGCRQVFPTGTRATVRVGVPIPEVLDESSPLSPDMFDLAFLPALVRVERGSFMDCCRARSDDVRDDGQAIS